MFVSAIIAAAGQGARLRSDRPKQFLDLGGRSLLELSIRAVAADERVTEIVVALPQDHLAATSEAWHSMLDKPLSFVAGGSRRQDSVANAFAKVSPRADIVIVHDAARPFVTSEVIARTVDAAALHGAAIAAIAVSDTVKQAEPALTEGAHRIISTIPRETVFLAQTPQAFRRDVFARMLDAAGDANATDEASLAERAGIPVWLVEGDAANVKVTTAADLEEARARLQAGGHSAVVRIGTGYDLHRLVARRPLILGGVRIPFDFGLDGHSDADIVCHAVTDAVLGAAAAGDIGRLFSDNDPKWKNADSVMLLRDAVARVHAMGYRVANVDVTVIAERPKLLPHLDAMRANLAAALHVDVNAVSIKGKTNEGVDATGRGESMACHAVALLAVRHSRFAIREEPTANSEQPESHGEKP
jgi:2-C-methyl-D-erythritol 4-phosphate cytidylyltransferase/2-C-methyl-D-erythritol 2,4-cyclodiphosphate synthase